MQGALGARFLTPKSRFLSLQSTKYLTPIGQKSMRLGSRARANDVGTVYGQGGKVSFSAWPVAFGVILSQSCVNKRIQTGQNNRLKHKHARVW